MRPGERGLSLVELLVSLVLLAILMSTIAAFLFDRRTNRSEQLAAETQANARSCMSIIVQQLRSAGWDPALAGIPVVALDPDLTDEVSQIEIFVDLDADGTTDADGEQILIRHVEDRIEWRRTADGPFETMAVDISNDRDGDGLAEPMFQPIPEIDPNRIRVQITARSHAPSPKTGEQVVFSTSSDVVLRKTL